MKKNQFNFIRIILALSIISTFVGCSATDSSSSSKIKIGTFGPYTGDAATDGIDSRNGAQLAIDQINKNGGVNTKQLSLVALDDQATAPQAMSVVQKLIQQEKVTAIVSGSYSTPTKTVAPVVQAQKIPMVVAYAVNPDITKGGKYVFRTIYSGPTQGTAMANYAVQEKGLKKIAVLFVNNDYGNSNIKGFSDQVSKLGGNVVISRNFVEGQKISMHF